MSPWMEYIADRPDWIIPILVAVEISLVCLIALTAIRIYRHDAAARYGIGVVGLLTIWLSLPVTLWMQSSGMASWAWQRVLVASPAIGVALPEAPVAPSSNNWLLVLWSMGTTLAILRLVHGAIRIQSLRRDAFPLDVQGSVSPILISDDVSGPVVVGAIQPAVLIPRRILAGLTEDELADVLAHEFAHVAKRHLMVAMFQRITAALLWPHPLIHLLNRQIVEAREEICDNVVIQSTGALRYAKVLLRVAECRVEKPHLASALGLFGPNTQLEKRVKNLLNPKRRIVTEMNYRRITFASLALALTVAAIGAARIDTEIIVQDPTMDTGIGWSSQASEPTQKPVSRSEERRAVRRAKQAKEKKSRVRSAERELAIARRSAELSRAQTELDLARLTEQKLDRLTIEQSKLAATKAQIAAERRLSARDMVAAKELRIAKADRASTRARDLAERELDIARAGARSQASSLERAKLEYDIARAARTADQSRLPVEVARAKEMARQAADAPARAGRDAARYEEAKIRAMRDVELTRAREIQDVAIAASARKADVARDLIQERRGVESSAAEIEKLKARLAALEAELERLKKQRGGGEASAAGATISVSPAGQAIAPTQVREVPILSKVPIINRFFTTQSGSTAPEAPRKGQVPQDRAIYEVKGQPLEYKVVAGQPVMGQKLEYKVVAGQPVYRDVKGQKLEYKVVAGQPLYREVKGQKLEYRIATTHGLQYKVVAGKPVIVDRIAPLKGVTTTVPYRVVMGTPVKVTNRLGTLAPAKSNKGSVKTTKKGTNAKSGGK